MIQDRAKRPEDTSRIGHPQPDEASLPVHTEITGEQSMHANKPIDTLHAASSTTTTTKSYEATMNENELTRLYAAFPAIYLHHTFAKKKNHDTSNPPRLTSPQLE